MGDEPLIPPRTEIRVRFPSPSRWFMAGLVFSALFALLGLVLRGVLSAHYGAVVERVGHLGPSDSIPYIRLLVALISLSYGVPQVSIVVMVWVAFAKAEWSDRFLWSAAVILTTTTLAPFLMVSISNSERLLIDYPWVTTVGGLITFGTWLFIVARSEMSVIRKRVLGSIFSLALFIVFFGPLLLGEQSILELICSLLFCAACVAFGVAFAEKVGVNLFERQRKAIPGLD